MTKNIRYALILLAICGVAVFFLALTNSITAPVIEEMDHQNRLKALEAVSGGFEIGEQEVVDGQPYVTYRIDLSEGGNAAGWILGLKSAGYGGEMTLVASYTPDGVMQYAQLLGHSETPGLGKKAEESWYMEKFKNTGGQQPVPTSKAMLSADDAQAISGSSVTFTAIARAIAGGSDYVKSLGGAQ
ncbi:MAG: FMN-binding protein [Sphaerochaeta sp.]|jgi:electron transport complex protein RnfG|nr:FMN-binding protein [Sphaerochaeta sp.]MDX9915353.1 FMN-binding protein [Sphaerochaeta sp.]